VADICSGAADGHNVGLAGVDFAAYELSLQRGIHIGGCFSCEPAGVCIVPFD
jgi:hypothetical protein